MNITNNTVIETLIQRTGNWTQRQSNDSIVFSNKHDPDNITIVQLPKTKQFFMHVGPECQLLTPQTLPLNDMGIATFIKQLTNINDTIIQRINAIRD